MSILSRNLEFLAESRFFHKIPKFLPNLDFFAKSWYFHAISNFHKISNFSQNLKILTKSRIFHTISNFHKNLDFFTKSQNFHKISNLSQNLEFATESQFFHKISNFSKNLPYLKIHSSEFSKKCGVDAFLDALSIPRTHFTGKNMYLKCTETPSKRHPNASTDASNLPQDPIWHTGYRIW